MALECRSLAIAAQDAVGKHPELLRVIPCGRRGERAAGAAGALRSLRKDSAVSTAPILPGKHDGHMDLRMAGALPAPERGIPYGTAAHPSPPPQRHVCAAQGLEIPGAWIPRFWECCSRGGVSLSGSFCFLEISRFGFSKTLSRGRSGHICRELSTQRVCPVLNPSESPGPAHPARTALGCQGRGVGSRAGITLQTSPGQRGFPGALLKNPPELQLQHN